MKNIAVLILTIAIVFGFAAFSYAEGSVRVTSFAGDVKIAHEGEEKSVACKPDMMLKAGDRVLTGEESYLEAAFDKSRQNSVKVGQNSNVVLKFDGDLKLELISGELYTLLKNLKKGSSFKMMTPSAVCGARGTGWYAKADNKTTVIEVFDGSVFIRGIDKDGKVMEKEFTIKKGYKSTIEKGKDPGEPTAISAERLTSLSGQITPVGVSKKQKMKAMERIIRTLDIFDFISDDRRDSVIEDRSSDRLDSIREKKDKKPKKDKDEKVKELKD